MIVPPVHADVGGHGCGLRVRPGRGEGLVRRHARVPQEKASTPSRRSPTSPTSPSTRRWPRRRSCTRPCGWSTSTYLPRTTRPRRTRCTSRTATTRSGATGSTPVRSAPSSTRHTGVAKDYYGYLDESKSQLIWEDFNYPVHSGYIVNGWWRLIWLVFEHRSPAVPRLDRRVHPGSSAAPPGRRARVRPTRRAPRSPPMPGRPRRGLAGGPRDGPEARRRGRRADHVGQWKLAGILCRAASTDPSMCGFVHRRRHRGSGPASEPGSSAHGRPKAGRLPARPGPGRLARPGDRVRRERQRDRQDGATSRVGPGPSRGVRRAQRPAHHTSAGVGGSPLLPTRGDRRDLRVASLWSASRPRGAAGTDSDDVVRIAIARDRRTAERPGIQVTRTKVFGSGVLDNLSPPRVRLEHAVLQDAPRARATRRPASRSSATRCRADVRRPLRACSRRWRPTRDSATARSSSGSSPTWHWAPIRCWNGGTSAVERAHALPVGSRQRRSRTGHALAFRDVGARRPRWWSSTADWDASARPVEHFSETWMRSWRDHSP